LRWRMCSISTRPPPRWSLPSRDSSTVPQDRRPWGGIGTG